MTEFPTSIGTSSADSITLLGQNLADDLLGKISFGELAYWLIVKERPTPGQLTVFEAVLIALADHGFTPTAIASRLTLYSAPESLQGAVAAGLLGGGSRFLGVTEDTGRFLDRALAHGGGDSGWIERNDEEWDDLARNAVQSLHSAGGRVPGLGHPVHKTGDPRVPVLISIAEQAGQRGPAIRLLEGVGRVHHDILGRRLPLNGAGVAGALLVDAGIPVSVLRGVALLARTAGLIGHLAEEMTRPIGPDVYALVDRNAVFRSPQPASKEES